MITKQEKKLTVDVLNENQKVISLYHHMNNNYDSILKVIKNEQKELAPWLDKYCKKQHIPQEYFVELLAQHIWDLHLGKK